MNISEEACWVLLDGLDLETRTGVDSISQNSGCEGSGEASLAVFQASANINWVGECDSSGTCVSVVGQTRKRRTDDGGGGHQPWWTAQSLCSLMNVRGSFCRRLVFAAEAFECNVVANEILFRIDRVQVPSLSPGQATGEGIGHIDDLVWSGVHLVDGGEAVRLATLWVIPVTKGLCLGRTGCSNCKGSDAGDDRELHFVLGC